MTARRPPRRPRAEEERRVAGLQRAAADRREGLARLAGQVNALRSPRGRRRGGDRPAGQASRAAAVARADRAQHDFTALETRVAGLDAGEEGLDAEHEAALAVLDDLDRAARQDPRGGDRRPTATAPALAARKEALGLGLNRKDGAGALLAATDPSRGLLGSVAALLTVDPGYETAIAAALGSAADASPSTDGDAAVAAIGHLKTDDLGRAGHAARRSPTDASTDDPPGLARPARPRDVRRRRRVAAPTTLRPAPGPAALQDRGRRRPRRRPRPGRRPARRHRGDPRRRRARRPLRRRRLRRRSPACSRSRRRRRGPAAARPRPSRPPSGSASTSPGSTRERLDAQRRVDVALAKLHESDATLAAVAEELGQLRHAGTLGPRRGRAARRARSPTAEEARDQDLAGLADLEARLAAAARRHRRGARHHRARAAGRRRPRRPPGARWTPGSRCARARSAPAPCTAAPTPWCAPPRPSVRPAPAPSSAASGWSARAGPPRPSASR